MFECFFMKALWVELWIDWTGPLRIRFFIKNWMKRKNKNEIKTTKIFSSRREAKEKKRKKLPFLCFSLWSRRSKGPRMTPSGLVMSRGHFSTSRATLFYDLRVRSVRYIYRFNGFVQNDINLFIPLHNLSYRPVYINKTMRILPVRRRREN